MIEKTGYEFYFVCVKKMKLLHDSALCNFKVVSMLLIWVFYLGEKCLWLTQLIQYGTDRHVELHKYCWPNILLLAVHFSSAPVILSIYSRCLLLFNSAVDQCCLDWWMIVALSHVFKVRVWNLVYWFITTHFRKICKSNS